MKKILFALTALSLLPFVSCEKEVENTLEETPVETTGEMMTIEARMSKESTKTSYTSDGKFTWLSTDQIIVITHADGDTDNQKNFTFSTSAGNITEEGRAATFTGTVTDGYTIDYAAYPTSLASDNTDSGYAAPFVKVPSSVSGLVSSAMLIGIGDGAGGYTFNTAMSLFKINVSGVPASAAELRLVTSDKTNYPLDGDFTLEESAGVVTLDFAHYHSEWSTYDKGYQTVDISAEGAIDGRDFYFNVPIGTYPARTLSIQVLDGSGNVMGEKVITKALSTNRNECLTLPTLTMDCWETLGTGKYADYWMQGYQGVVEDLWDVVIQRNVDNTEKYRIINPYAEGVNMTQTLTHDKYLYFSIDGEGTVTFTDYITGVLATGSSSDGTNNLKLVYVSTDKNTIVAGDASTPKVIQLSPRYEDANKSSWNWPRNGLPYLVRIVMPDHVSAYTCDISFTGNAGGCSFSHSAASDSKTIFFISNKSYAQYIYDGGTTAINPVASSFSSIYWSNKTASGSISRTGAELTSDGFTTGKLYVSWCTYDGSYNPIYVLQSKPFYFLNPADQSALLGTYSFSAIQALFHYYRKAWIDITSTNANSLVLAISDDPTKGNVKLTNIFGFGCDGSTSSFVIDHKVSDGLGWNTDADSDLTGTFAAGTAVYGQFASSSLDFPNPEESGFMTYNGTNVYVDGVYYSGGASYSNGYFGFTFTSDGSTATLTANPVAIMTLTLDDGNYNADHGIVYVTNNSSFTPTALVATRSLE